MSGRHFPPPDRGRQAPEFAAGPAELRWINDHFFEAGRIVNMGGSHLSLADDVPVCIRRLSRDQMARAFPLLRETGRCDSPEAWLDYASEFIGENQEKSWPSGIVVAEQASRCIVGLFSFLVRP